MADFEAKRLVKEYVYNIDAAPEKVFPLLCPVREYDWIEGWSCELIHSESGVAENNCVFKTTFPDLGEATWVVSRYDKESFIIEFVIVYPDAIAEKLDIALEAGEGGGSVIRWTRTYTGLSEKGNRLIEHFGDEMIDSRMAWLNESLNHYCSTGKKLVGHRRP